ncbi:PREDICTED: RING-H2 finger protein ATL78-like [Lupinus angustifolius]|uniref:RING-H2 finger protein ATL78-like n=1 Tax=Lupinus angustifolius TaxID=3871 RepID=UPI00092EAB76|nr:PREDICTED: RING-H2 finger protein ATL78-like [Lupinus angustifolius]
MYASTSFTSHFIHELLGDFHSRRLLLPNPLNQSNSLVASINSHNFTNLNLGSCNFDANVVMVLLVILCFIICLLGLNSIIRCALRFSDLFIHIDSSSTSNLSARLEANTGIKKKALKTFPIVSYSTEMNLPAPGLDTECNHGIYVPCINKWLSSHSSCPECRQCLVETYHYPFASQISLLNFL